MLIGDGEEFINSLLEGIGIVLPYEILQENAQAVIAGLLRPAQFLIDMVLGSKVSDCHISVSFTAVRGR